MRLITVATHSEGYFPFLVKSCERMGARLDVLGWGQPWTGYNAKTRLQLAYVTELRDDEIVCFVDAYDTLLLRPLDDLERGFRDLSAMTGCRVVVGCENQPNALQAVASRTIFGACQGRAIANSGTFVGFAKDVREMLLGMMRLDAADAANDQILLNSLCLIAPGTMHVDCDALLFLTVSKPLQNFVDGTHTTIRHGQLYRHGTRPYVAHGNGNTDMHDLIAGLGYEVRPEVARAIRSQHLSRLCTKTVHYTARAGGVLACIIAVVCIARVLSRARTR